MLPAVVSVSLLAVNYGTPNQINCIVLFRRKLTNAVKNTSYLHIIYLIGDFADRSPRSVTSKRQFV